MFQPLVSIAAHLFKYCLWRARYAGPHVRCFIQRDGARIGYMSYGEGLPVIFLHGGLGGSFDWFAQTPAFVANGRRVILVDSRGHGSSTMGHGAYSYRALAADVVSIMGACGIAKSDILGWSDGGNVALILARDHPERVARMVIISANFTPSGLTPSAREQIALDPWARRIRRWLSGTNKPALVHQIHQLWKTRPLLTQNDLDAIVAPTLVLVGDNDNIDLEHTRMMANALADAALVVLPRTGHAAPQTRARQVNRLALSFLDANAKGLPACGRGASKRCCK